METASNVLYLTIRAKPDKPLRPYSWSQDGGRTWAAVQWHAEVPEPSSCQGSAIRFTDSQNQDKNRVLLANPAGPARERLTVRLSYDECQSWNAGQVLWPGPAAYSDLCVLPDLTIACLYEGGEQNPYQNIKFARFDLEWLTAGADHLVKTTE